MRLPCALSLVHHQRTHTHLCDCAAMPPPAGEGAASGNRIHHHSAAAGFSPQSAAVNRRHDSPSANEFLDGLKLGAAVNMCAGRPPAATPRPARRGREPELTQLNTATTIWLNAARDLSSAVRDLLPEQHSSGAEILRTATNDSLAAVILGCASNDELLDSIMGSCLEAARSNVCERSSSLPVHRRLETASLISEGVSEILLALPCSWIRDRGETGVQRAIYSKQHVRMATLNAVIEAVATTQSDKLHICARICGLDFPHN